jgi:branched-chain amino acid transport system permease protein
MSTPTAEHPHAIVTSHAKVKRSTKSSWAGLGVAVPLVIFMAAIPYIVERGLQSQLVTLFSLIVLATMWNLLAGYGGMVSVGQQAYIGIGAYGLVYLADTVGLDPFLAVPVSVIIAGILSIPISFLAFRLVGGYFAIGTWVIAEVVKQITTQIDALGAGVGLSLTSLNDLSPGRRIAYVYWLSLAAVVIAVGVTYFLMRSRLGLGFTAIRDDQTAASSLGVRVTHSKRFVFVVSAMGCALAGGMIAANTLRITPDSIYSVNFSAFMIFMVIIGGIGTIEGPIVGAIVFFALQQWLSDLGTWYLVIIGVLAIVITLFLPRGLWGLISGNGRIRLFPVGYRLVNPIERFGLHPQAAEKD